MKTNPGRFLEHERPGGAKTTLPKYLSKLYQRQLYQIPKAALDQFIAGQPPNKREPRLDQQSCLPNPQVTADAWGPQLKAQPSSWPADSGENDSCSKPLTFGTNGIADIVTFRLNLTFSFLSVWPTCSVFLFSFSSFPFPPFLLISLETVHSLFFGYHRN